MSMINAKTIDVVIFYPVDHIVDDLASHFRIAQIELGYICPAPWFTRLFIDRVTDFAFFIFIIIFRMLVDLGMVPSGMMRHPIDDQLHAVGVCSINQFFEIFVITEL